MHLAKNIELLTLLAAAQVASGNHEGETSGGNCGSGCPVGEICHGVRNQPNGMPPWFYEEGRNCEK